MPNFQLGEEVEFCYHPSVESCTLERYKGIYAGVELYYVKNNAELTGPGRPKKSNELQPINTESAQHIYHMGEQVYIKFKKKKGPGIRLVSGTITNIVHKIKMLPELNEVQVLDMYVYKIRPQAQAQSRPQAQAQSRPQAQTQSRPQAQTQKSTGGKKSSNKRNRKNNKTTRSNK